MGAKHMDGENGINASTVNSAIPARSSTSNLDVATPPANMEIDFSVSIAVPITGQAMGQEGLKSAPALEKAMVIAEKTGNRGNIVTGANLVSAPTLRVSCKEIAASNKEKSTQNKPVHQSGVATSFTGTLYGKSVTLNGVKEEKLVYKKQNPAVTEAYRKEFQNYKRELFLKQLKVDDLKKAGISDELINKIKSGKLPRNSGWQVHHIKPLDAGGNNEIENLVLIRNHVEHKVITNRQNELTDNLSPGDIVTFDFPAPRTESHIYPENPTPVPFPPRKNKLKEKRNTNRK